MSTSTSSLDLLEAFAKDTGAAAEAVAKLLENPSPEAAAALLEELPSLLPDDPELATVIAEAMAAEFADVIKNKTDANGMSHAESDGRFDGGNGSAKNDGNIDFKGNSRAKAQADEQSKSLGYKGIDDLMEKSVSVPKEKIDTIVEGGNFICEPHEAIAALRTLSVIKSNVGGEVKLSERALRHYVCGERRHHGGKPDISRLRSLPKAIDAVRHSDSRHWELDNRPIVVVPGEKPTKGTQAVYCKNQGKTKTYAYADSGVLNGWQVN